MDDAILSLSHLSHRYRLNKKTVLTALDDVSFQIRRGEIFGLVGESGSGKSTLARCILNLCRPVSGSVFYEGIDTCDPRQFRAHKKMLQARRQIILQDSDSSLNPRMRADALVAEPLQIHRLVRTRKERREKAAFYLSCVGLDPSYLDRYPSQLSGGQRQRVAIARALSMNPDFLVADEPIASLDVSVQAQIVNLFKRLQKERGFTFLFIAHDLAMVEFLCDRVGVLYRGRLVELAPTKELFSHPLHSYTQALLSAVPISNPRLERARPPFSYRPEPDVKSRLCLAAPQHYVSIPCPEGEP